MTTKTNAVHFVNIGTTLQYIEPQDPKHGIWKFETTARCMCLKYNLSKGSAMRCDKFENKLGQLRD